MTLTEKLLQFETTSSSLASLRQAIKHVFCRKVWSKELLSLLQPDSHGYLAARGALKTMKSLLDTVLLAGDLPTINETFTKNTCSSPEQNKAPSKRPF